VILVDTSIWIESFRQADSAAARRLTSLIDAAEVALAAPVRVEILSGAALREQARLRRLLSALPCWYPTQESWQRIESWVTLAVAAGERFGVGDLLIASTAVEHGAKLWSRDGDFRRMSELGLVSLFEP
jgi:predicted nucleic acid-binding protein